MKKRSANKVLNEGQYLLKQEIKLKFREGGSIKENTFVIESFGAAKIYFETNEGIVWYEVWANLKNSQTGSVHKMLLQKLIQMFPNAIKK